MFCFRSCFAEFRLDLDLICCRGRFDSSWVRVFIDIPIANDAEALLQDRVLVLCGVCARHDDVVVVFVAMDAGRDGVVRVFEDSLNDVDALFVQKILLCMRICMKSEIKCRQTFILNHTIYGQMHTIYTIIIHVCTNCKGTIMNII